MINMGVIMGGLYRSKEQETDKTKNHGTPPEITGHLVQTSGARGLLGASQHPVTLWLN